MGEAAVVFKRRHAEVNAAVWSGVGVAALDQGGDHADLVRDVLNSGRLDVWWEKVQRGAIGMELAGPKLGELDQCLSSLLRVTNGFVIDIGDVPHVQSRSAAELDHTAEDVLRGEGAEIADMSRAINRGAAAVEAQGLAIERDEGTGIAGKGVVEPESGHGVRSMRGPEQGASASCWAACVLCRTAVPCKGRLLVGQRALGSANMEEYHRLLRKVLDHGSYREDRTGVGAYSVFGEQSRYDLSQGFPLVTTKKLHLRSIIHELLWFIKGETNVAYLRENQVTIWDEWADDEGNLGPVYGAQWRAWRGAPEAEPVDQIASLIEGIKSNPFSRRHLVSAWNVARIDEMALPPCHCLFQFFVAEGKLSCQLYQRSADLFLGVPFNIASYALLTLMVAQVCGLQPGDFVHTFGDLHLYSNHLEQARLQLTRESRSLPTMRLNLAVTTIDGFRFEDFTLEGYDPWPTIKAPIAV